MSTIAFNIIDECVVNYNQQDQLVVMLINNNGRYIIEVTTRSKLISRRPIDTLHRGLHALGIISNKLQRMPNYFSALSLFQIAFQYGALEEVLFLVELIASGEHNHSQVKELYFKYPIRYKEEWNLELEDDLEFILHVYFAGRKKPIGKFTQRFESKVFQFVLNPRK